MEVVVLCGMSDEKVYAELFPIASLEKVEKIYLIRRQPFILNVPKLISYSPVQVIRRHLLLSELYRLFILFYICLSKTKVKVIIGIYFVPHGLYAGLVGKLFGKSIIQYIIGTDRPKVMKNRLFLNVLNWAKYIGVRGNTSRKELITLGISPNKFFIPVGVNSIDFNLFKPSESVKDFDLIYSGRIDCNKQVIKLLNAIAQIYSEYPNLRVAILGDGPERKKLEDLSQQLNLTDHVFFLGNRAYAEIPEYLKKSRIFMMASDFEGLPVAMLEAISCGLPVVVPNVGDITDVAKHGVNSLVVDPPSIVNFVHAINSLLNDRTLYMQLADGASSTRRIFISEYSFEKARQIWQTVLNP